MGFKEEFAKLPQGPAREALIQKEVFKRGAPKLLVPVTVDGPNGTKITYQVTSDVINIDGVRVPMTANTAQIIANHFGMHLPTSKMSKQIWQASDTKIRANPLSAGGFSAGGKHYSADDVVAGKIGDSDAALAYNDLTDKELQKYKAQNPGKTPTLIAGHGKDILAPMSDPSRMSIGGWQGTDGGMLQPHGSPHYADSQVEYGTWARLIADPVIVTNKDGSTYTTTIDKLQKDKTLGASITATPGKSNKYNVGDSNKPSTPSSTSIPPGLPKSDSPATNKPLEPVKLTPATTDSLLKKVDDFLAQIGLKTNFASNQEYFIKKNKRF